ncbi:UvrD-helicase domain-containing protein [Aquimonas voraii]|uniref:RecBCD enzyme subunit RecB n=1 Tax=Aquimonas voraii TaxID=265719 RepID=A0A1G6X5J8_9GAMM|nr:UvrD-helicase domain-containing protein [Aquimonas voraii]SDD72546.1 DNA helicase/exodeoxyribonuclease V, beta subunit [Aquimonas voraii]
MHHDWTTLPLGAGGRSLIEASAGTGKTWTIAVLYLRLLLEQGLSPRAIVVTTFTEAAAQELRERLRRRLLWAETRAAAFVSAIDRGESLGPRLRGGDGDEAASPGFAAGGTQGVESTSDPALDWLQARWRTPGTAARDLQALRLALAELEHAPVSTLHGLCRRILAEQPIEAGADFRAAELVSTESLLDELSADLWRRLQQGSEDEPLYRLQRMTGKPLSLAQLRGLLKSTLMAGIEVEAPTLPAEDSETARRAQPDAARAARLQAVVDNAALFNKRAKLPRALAALAQALDPARNTQGLPAWQCLGADDIEVLANARALTGVSKPGKTHAGLLAATEFAAALCEAVLARMQAAPQAFLHALAAAGRARMDALLSLRRQQSFDSLLESVDAALAREAQAAGDGGRRPLADTLFAQWPVALVDEFQDTDALQFGILDRLYRDAAGRERGRLVMIGDPKQAIYRFRGGDIHAYRRAAEQVDEHLNLAVNQRSSRALVAGCNALFALGGEALSTDADHDIRYLPVQAAGRADDKPYRVGGSAPEAALVLHFQADSAGGQEARRQTALRACASQIVELLNDPAHTLDGRRLGPADIAVLLPRAADIARLRLLLEARGVPCVATSRDSVLAGDTARELQVLLHGVVHPGDAGALRAAAATRLWGARFAEIRRWQDEPEGLQQVALRFRALHAVLIERGVAGVIEALLDQIAERAMSTRRGERLLTDLRHLGELLQEASEDLGGPEELLAWLQHQREGAAVDEAAADERQLRIESQQPRLRLLTLHASKGLEFPIVFLPLMWANGAGSDRAPWRRSDAHSARPRLSYAEEAKAQQQADLQDERFRLLYVALTRAVHACHVYALDPTRPKRAGWNLQAHQGVDAAPLDVLMQRAFEARPELAAALQAGEAPALHPIGLRAAWPAATRTRFAEADRSDTPRRARELRPLPARAPEAKHSFTSLSRAGRAQSEALLDAEAPAQDESLPVEAARLESVHDEAPHPDLLALAGLRGAGFGNALHSLLELRVIGTPLVQQLEHVQATLAGAGLRTRDFEPLGLARFSERLAQRLDAALAAPLGLEHAPGLTLAEVPARDQRAELGFDFALPEIALADLAAACARHGEPELVPASSRRIAGLMNGKIDLVFRLGERFHVLDYKGNWLGERVGDYLGERLSAAMDHSHYRFQALLYTLALDRYLQQRLGDAYGREQQLGECVYLFLRAAGLAPGAGVWRQRFAPGLIEDAQAALAGAWHTAVAA